ncbi:hypothetical protein ACWGE0_11815 [Lentzea sp. NPDC054927]
MASPVALSLLTSRVAAEPQLTLNEEGAAAEAGQPDQILLSWAKVVLHEALRRSSLLDARPYEIFGQGSRVNNTYIEHASDIDLVLMLKMPFESNIDVLGGPGIGGCEDSCQADLYRWEEFREDVMAALAESYVVSMGRRCLNVDDPDSLFGEMVDILLATEYRLYFGSPAPGVVAYEQGVFFRDREGRAIVNFPKQHRRNGDQKNRCTGGRFKEVVRLAKRARRLAEWEHMIVEGTAPSYLLECLLYNVPDHVYRTSSLEQAYLGAIEWLRRCHREDPVTFAGLQCQNGINRLFGKSPDQWEAGEAGRITDVLHGIVSPSVIGAA